MAADIVLRKITVHYDGYQETHWLIFEAESISHPLVVLTDLEMKRLVNRHAEIVGQESGSPSAVACAAPPLT